MIIRPCFYLSRPLRLVLTMLMFGCLTACTVDSADTSNHSPSQATNDSTLVSKASYSPYTGEPLPRELLWGDTHLHTRLSQDAFTFGVSLGPEDAFRFARGETVVATHGETVRLGRPLDFLVVSDHAEGLGAMSALVDGHPDLVKVKKLRDWSEALRSGDNQARQKIADQSRMEGWPPELEAEAVRRPAWEYLAQIADAFYEPGRFTTLHGFEWTSWPGGNNLHRVVIFADAADKVTQVMPFSQFDSEDPTDLWDYLDRYEKLTGGRALAIPHNGNLSNGVMFPEVRDDGRALTREYAAKRKRWEPLAEVTQIKGDAETHPFLSPDDEFADYETWDFGNFTGVPKDQSMLQHEYARSALKLGLRVQKQSGANPYQFGMIGATDSHTGLSTAEEDNFFGKHSGGMEPNNTRWNDPVGKVDENIVPGHLMTSSGYAAVWATENTRAGIFDAMQRKEVYATTGPRIMLRFFGGWRFTQSDAQLPDIAPTGYAKGVPMGGDLPRLKHTSAPSFLIAAARDPRGANLDRIQIVKGWIDSNNELHEQVIDVVWSGGSARQNIDGSLKPVASTVDLNRASYTNSVGASELSAVWTDPDFNPAQAAFYYVRVLEIPTPRWTSYDAWYFAFELPDSLRISQQERAYSSPIWYSP